MTLYKVFKAPCVAPSTLQSESEVTQSCLTLCDPMDCSLPGSSIHGIFQARVLEWVAVSFSRGSSPPRDQTQVSRIVGRCFTIWATREVTLAHCRSSINRRSLLGHGRVLIQYEPWRADREIRLTPVWGEPEEWPPPELCSSSEVAPVTPKRRVRLCAGITLLWTEAPRVPSSWACGWKGSLSSLLGPQQRALQSRALGFRVQVSGRGPASLGLRPPPYSSQNIHFAGVVALRDANLVDVGESWESTSKTLPMKSLSLWSSALETLLWEVGRQE